MLNAREAAKRNHEVKLVLMNKLYSRLYLEMRDKLPSPMGTYPKLKPHQIAKNEVQRQKGGVGYRCNRWTGEVAVASNAPRARGLHGANVPSMFGKPLVRCEG